MDWEERTLRVRSAGGRDTSKAFADLSEEWILSLQDFSASKARAILEGLEEWEMKLLAEEPQPGREHMGRWDNPTRCRCMS